MACHANRTRLKIGWPLVPSKRTKRFWRRHYSQIVMVARFLIHRGLLILFCIASVFSSIAATHTNISALVAEVDRARILRAAENGLRLKPPAITDQVAT